MASKRKNNTQDYDEFKKKIQNLILDTIAEDEAEERATLLDKIDEAARAIHAHEYVPSWCERAVDAARSNDRFQTQNIELEYADKSEFDIDFAFFNTDTSNIAAIIGSVAKLASSRKSVILPLEQAHLRQLVEGAVSVWANVSDDKAAEMCSLLSENGQVFLPPYASAEKKCKWGCFCCGGFFSLLLSSRGLFSYGCLFFLSSPDLTRKSGVVPTGRFQAALEDVGITSVFLLSYGTKSSLDQARAGFPVSLMNEHPSNSFDIGTYVTVRDQDGNPGIPVVCLRDEVRERAPAGILVERYEQYAYLGATYGGITVNFGNHPCVTKFKVSFCLGWRRKISGN
jgi:hypothetical protein